ncbi:macrophage mannose receptor 1-like [Oryzias melastigma]|uniref:macrophage mannose receptor 1-like n=1 Tax=Oryzias melastigma TaxID=30732 RepID=UPI00168D854A|nr:macrophage mannose receptor 1-like [Oryzias melastigma]
MERFLLIFAASALSAVSSRPARQYHVILDPMNWIEAQRYCREKFTDLASVDNTDDVNILMNMGLPTTLVKFKSSSKLFQEPGRRALQYPNSVPVCVRYRIRYWVKTPWIGLYYDGGTWQWSMTDKDFFKPDGANYRNWTPGEPSSDWNNVQCVYMTANGQWNDASCEGAKKPMCSDVRGSNVTFVHIDTFMTWPEAQKYCREHYTDLASVRSSAENQKIMDLKPAEEDVWIGLSKTSWTWSNGSTTTFYYWNDGEPNDQTAVCAMMLSRKLGKWVDATCEQQRPFICHEGSSATFVHINISMTWTEAQSYCRGHHTDLASVRNMEENQKIMGIKPPGGQVWLGLRTGTWAWSSASTAVYRNWAEREPNDSGDCVVANFDDTGKWEDWNCNDSKAFICYHDVVISRLPKLVVKLSVQKSVSLDLDDLVVLNSMLQQLTQKLMERPANGKVKLSWRTRSDGKIFHKRT